MMTRLVAGPCLIRLNVIDSNNTFPMQLHGDVRTSVLEVGTFRYHDTGSGLSLLEPRASVPSSLSFVSPAVGLLMLLPMHAGVYLALSD